MSVKPASFTAVLSLVKTEFPTATTIDGEPKPDVTQAISRIASQLGVPAFTAELPGVFSALTIAEQLFPVVCRASIRDVINVGLTDFDTNLGVALGQDDAAAIEQLREAYGLTEDPTIVLEEPIQTLLDEVVKLGTEAGYAQVRQDASELSADAIVGGMENAARNGSVPPTLGSGTPQDDATLR